MLNFLDSEYIKNVKVIYFINSMDKPVSIDEICNHIGSSRKTVLALLSIIESDLALYDFELKQTKNKKYYLKARKKGEKIYLDEYLLNCGKRSLLFLMVEELFFKGHINTITFCANRYISQTTFSRGKKKLDSLLGESQLGLTNYVKDGIIGDEYQVRNFYFNFFDRFYTTQAWPFEEFRRIELEDSYGELLTTIFGIMSPIKKKKIYYLLCIIKRRIIQGHYVNEISASFEYANKYNGIYELIERYVGQYNLTPQMIKNEVQFFICVIYTQDIADINIDYLHSLLDYAEKNAIQVQMNKLWIRTFNEFFERKFTNIEELKWHQELSKFHLNIEFLYSSPALFSKNNLEIKEKKYEKIIYQKAETMYRTLMMNPDFYQYKNKNLKNGTDKDFIIQYYYYFHYSFIKSRRIKPIYIFVEDTVDRVNKSILIEKLKLVFGDSIEITDNIFYEDVLVLTNQEILNNHDEEVRIFSYIDEDEENFKKIINNIQERIYNQLLLKNKIERNVGSYEN